MHGALLLVARPKAEEWNDGDRFLERSFTGVYRAVDKAPIPPYKDSVLAADFRHPSKFQQRKPFRDAT